MERFLAARSLHELPDPSIVLQGVPWDGSVSWRRGAAEGPSRIREASDSIEEFSLRQRRTLTDVPVVDVGDVVLPADQAGAMEAIARATAEWAGRGAVVVTLGGDHSISIGTSRGLHRVYPDLAHVVIDAHFDLREEYDASPYSHACGTRRMAELGPTVVLGVRSAEEAEFRAAEAGIVSWSQGLELTAESRARIGDRPVHLSLDCDVLDPSVLPGTGNPEPGGPTYLELLSALEAIISSTRVVAVDVCEVAPPLDPSGMSAVVGASLVRELLLMIGAR